MKYFVELDQEAEKHLARHIKAGNKKLLKKIFSLLQELEAHPETGTGKPYQLRHEQRGVWSRSIDDRHRMLYIIDGAKVTVFVISL
jgi:toxin-antitoxin system, toxin component, Txe/YoeB family